MQLLRAVAVSLAAASVLAGCTALPLSLSKGQSDAARGDRAGSWMLPAAKGQNLLYVSSYYGYVNVYSYPKGKLVGTLTGFGILDGECSDKRGDVWIVDNENATLYEYAHGGTKPIATIVPRTSYSDLFSCAVNPRNGDLAVGTGNEVLLIYHHARGTPSVYRDYPIEAFMYGAYDGNGDLFVAGLTTVYQFAFAELAKGAASIENISLDQSIDRPGGVAAMTGEVALGDGETGTIYEFQINGSSGTKVGTTPLDGTYNSLCEFLIRGAKVVAATNSGSVPAVDVFDFPAGGEPVKSITQDLKEPLGVALSLAR